MWSRGGTIINDHSASPSEHNGPQFPLQSVADKMVEWVLQEGPGTFLTVVLRKGLAGNAVKTFQKLDPRTARYSIIHDYLEQTEDQERFASLCNADGYSVVTGAEQSISVWDWSRYILCDYDPQHRSPGGIIDLVLLTTDRRAEAQISDMRFEWSSAPVRYRGCDVGLRCVANWPYVWAREPDILVYPLGQDLEIVTGFEFPFLSDFRQPGQLWDELVAAYCAMHSDCDVFYDRSIRWVRLMKVHEAMNTNGPPLKLLCHLIVAHGGFDETRWHIWDEQRGPKYIWIALFDPHLAPREYYSPGCYALRPQ